MLRANLLMLLHLAVAMLPAPALAQGAAQAILSQTIVQTEQRLEARVGVFVLDSATGWHWGHRQDERFLMASTFKSLLCGAVLAAVERGEMSLDEALPIHAEAVVGHAPVTQGRIGQSLPVRDLCLATLDHSDNGAANLLLDRLGGPPRLTAFLRGIGDPVTRLDRIEPDLNRFVPGDPRDTTSPAAMAATWQRLLLGDALAQGARHQLADWMRHGALTGALLRAHLPEGWSISDRSGGGRHHTRNIVALITPPGHGPYIVAIYLSDTPADWQSRNAAVSRLGQAVLGLIAERMRQG